MELWTYLTCLLARESVFCHSPFFGTVRITDFEHQGVRPFHIGQPLRSILNEALCNSRTRTLLPVPLAPKSGGCPGAPIGCLLGLAGFILLESWQRGHRAPTGDKLRAQAPKRANRSSFVITQYAPRPEASQAAWPQNHISAAPACMSAEILWQRAQTWRTDRVPRMASDPRSTVAVTTPHRLLHARLSGSLGADGSQCGGCVIAHHAVGVGGPP